jgi:hypothetical protein
MFKAQMLFNFTYIHMYVFVLQVKCQSLDLTLSLLEHPRSRQGLQLTSLYFVTAAPRHVCAFNPNAEVAGTGSKPESDDACTIDTHSIEGYAIASQEQPPNTLFRPET